MKVQMNISDQNNLLAKNSKQNVNNTDDSKSIADVLAEDTEPLTDYLLDDPNFVSLEDLKEKEFSQTDTDLANPSPANLDSQSVGGHATGLDIDDDVVATAQTMGLALDETDDEPAELNIADAVDQAEREHWDN